MWTRLIAKLRTAFSNPLARVGSITAIFSLIAAIYGGWQFVSSHFEAHRNVDRLTASANLALDARDYPGAWRSLEEASAIDSNSAAVARVREDVAMRWLEDVHLAEKQTFTEVTSKLAPVLSLGIASTKSPQRQADLLAHLGWSYFLQSRDGPTGPDPLKLYRDALAKDTGNPYAEAMWGHWILWNGGAIPEAGKHFAIALATRPDVHPFVRRLQLGLLAERHSLEADREVVRIANDVRTEGGAFNAGMRRAVFTTYYAHMLPPDQSEPFLNAVAPADNLATFEWLTAGVDPADGNVRSRAYIHGALLERAGRRAEALAAYRALKATIGLDASGTLVLATNAAIARLSKPVAASRS